MHGRVSWNEATYGGVGTWEYPDVGMDTTTPVNLLNIAVRHESTCSAYRHSVIRAISNRFQARWPGE